MAWVRYWPLRMATGREKVIKWVVSVMKMFRRTFGCFSTEWRSVRRSAQSFFYWEVRAELRSKKYIGLGHRANEMHNFMVTKLAADPKLHVC